MNYMIILQISFVFFLLFISAQDIRSSTISDYHLAIFSTIHLTLQLLDGTAFSDILKGLLTGFLLYYIIYLGAKIFYKEEVFGFGDVLLLSSIGIVLGAERTIFAGLLTFYVALIPIIVLSLRKKSLNLKQQIPLAPAICTASLFALYAGDKIIIWLKGFIF